MTDGHTSAGSAGDDRRQPPTHITPEENKTRHSHRHGQKLTRGRHPHWQTTTMAGPACKTALNALQDGPYRDAKRAVSRRETGHIATRNGAFGKAACKPPLREYAPAIMQQAPQGCSLRRLPMYAGRGAMPPERAAQPPMAVRKPGGAHGKTPRWPPGRCTRSALAQGRSGLSSDCSWPR